MDRIENAKSDDALSDAALDAVCGGDKYTDALQSLGNYWATLSNVLKGQEDTKKAIASNLR